MSGNSPLVSVLIPAYNHEKYVQETINSIINQTYQNIELIIVDDGSPDSTWEKIQEMKEKCEKRFSNVIFETKKNEGTCKTINRLISLSNGEYIYQIASDDMAKPEAIEKEVDFLSKNLNYSLVVGDDEMIDAEGKRCYWDEQRNNVYDKEKAKYLTFCDFLKTQRDFDFTSEEFGMYHTLYRGNYIPNGFLIRKNIFEKIGLYTPEAPLEDYWLMMQISKYAKLKYLDEVLFSYRWHENNAIKNREKAISNAMKTRELENKILSDITTLKKNNALPDIYCFLSMNKEIKKLENDIQELKGKSNYHLSLILNENKISKTYYRYKIFSKILLGKARKRYKEKAEIYHNQLRMIRDLKSNIQKQGELN